MKKSQSKTIFEKVVIFQISKRKKLIITVVYCEFDSLQIRFNFGEFGYQKNIFLNSERGPEKTLSQS